MALNHEKTDEFEKLMVKRRNRVQPESNSDNEEDKSPKDREAEIEQKETRVGKRLNDSTQRRVIMMVLAMLFSVPILSISTYYQETDSFDFSMRYLDNFEA